MFEYIGIMTVWFVCLVVFSYIAGDTVSELFVGPKGGSNSVVGKIVAAAIFCGLTLFVIGWRLI